MNGEKTTRRSGLAIMVRMIGLIAPLLHIMLLAIVLGTIGYLCAIFLTVFASIQMLSSLEFFSADAIASFAFLLIVQAVLRGLLHYAEQYCNHYIAFRLLALIRHKVFAALRRLAPAKLDGRDKGNLISIITSDIELLEVFYAHTISPIAIAFFTSLIMVWYIGRSYAPAGVLALFAYVTVGVLLPLYNGRKGAAAGMEFRNAFGELNSFVLESLRGIEETIQYDCGEARAAQISERSKAMNGLQKTLSGREGANRALTNTAVLAFSFAMLLLNFYALQNGAIGFDALVINTVAMMGSFGPVAALSALSNNLNQTLASGERVLSLLEEEPLVEEVPAAEEEAGADVGQLDVTFRGAALRDVSFSYEEGEVLRDYSLALQPGKITGIVGPSGCGKSTLLKLLMRFYDVAKGSVSVDEEDVRTIPTAHLRDMESFMTQETHLFHDSIAANIAIAKENASEEEIEAAAKKAAIHEFIMTLPKGYETEVGELGGTLSAGERQRIGMARVFLHDAPLVLLDEPTSNLDSLNEGAILKAVKEEASDKTVVLVSHRASSMFIADSVVEV